MSASVSVQTRILQSFGTTAPPSQPVQHAAVGLTPPHLWLATQEAPKEETQEELLAETPEVEKTEEASGSRGRGRGRAHSRGRGAGRGRAAGRGRGRGRHGADDGHDGSKIEKAAAKSKGKVKDDQGHPSPTSSFDHFFLY